MNAVHAGGGAPVAMPTAAGMIVNVVAFQIGWFACVLGAAHGWPWAGVAVAAAVVALHAARATRPAAELKLVASAVLVGLLWDSSLALLGWMGFAAGTLVEGFAPPWILALWALFATTLNVSLDWLKGRPLVAVLFGAIGGPLAYWGGSRLGAIVLVEPVPALIALSAGWAVITPLLAALARHYDGIHERKALA